MSGMVRDHALVLDSSLSSPLNVCWTWRLFPGLRAWIDLLVREVRITVSPPWSVLSLFARLVA
jgi:hypothetical protein